MTNITTIQIIKALKKLGKSGITDDKVIMQLTYEKVSKVNLTPIEKIIILEYKEALKNKTVTKFLCRANSKGDEKNGISN